VHDDALIALREAARVSPDNVPLRLHLGELLLERANPAEAEAEFRAVLALEPNGQRAKLGLARAFFAAGKRSEALVVVDDLLASGEAPARAHLLQARLLIDADAAGAERAYRRAVALDAGLADEELAARFGAEPLRVPAREALVGAAAEVERPTLTFADVGGMDELKEEIRRKIVYPVRNPEIHRAYGKTIGGGILMYGPPGCGKTFLARATAGEVAARFIAVGLNDVLDMWLGNSEKNLHAYFEQARAAAPCVLFFDEVDALAASRADLRRSAGRMVINQFLAEFDGVERSNDGVLVLAATNAPWDVDAAFRRPGRFDRILFVPPPDAAARAAILRVHVRGKPVEDLDFERLARVSEGFSGADLAAGVDRAVEDKLAEAVRSGGVVPLRTKDLVDALGRTPASAAQWFAVARNYVRYANDGNLYEDVRRYLKM
jgi:AAA+ superfamily predicted ATPase